VTDAARARQRERRRLVRLHRYETEARGRGLLHVAGIDEVGRGPLAGPVVAACVLTAEPLMLAGLDDSKRVKPERRVELAAEIRARVLGWAVAEASVEEIERHNIYWATVLAMERALAALRSAPHFLLIDAIRLKSYGGEQLPVIGGDAKCATIAAASIIAKVHRDALLVELDARHPEYGFADHKGYATPRHLAAIAKHGPCEHHRRGFAPVREALG